MVYKIGNMKDLARLPITDENTMKNLIEFTKVLSQEYGEDRDIDHDDGGYVLYAPKGTDCEEFKEYFDYSKNEIECVNRCGDICCAMYLLTNEYAVVIVMSISDAPMEITDAFEED